MQSYAHVIHRVQFQVTYVTQNCTFVQFQVTCVTQNCTFLAAAIAEMLVVVRVSAVLVIFLNISLMNKKKLN